MQLAVVTQEAPKPKNWFNNDIWLFSTLGVDVSETKSDYRLNFGKISQDWLKNAGKKFIKLTASTRSTGTLIHYVSSLNYLSSVIEKFGQTNTDKDINRELMLHYITEIKQAGLSAATRKKRLLNLKLFFELSSRDSWLNLDNPNILYKEDIPREPKALPKFIPENVLSQLNDNIETLEESVMRMVLIIQDCGMRITELLTIPFSCTVQDKDDDFFLHTHQAKMDKDHTIPITKEVANIIKEQQSYVDCEFSDCEYLFPMPKKNSAGRTNAYAGKPYKIKTIITRLNALAKSANITDESGKLFHFTTHMFRHTVGTRMINNGVPQHIVQRYLGHESPAMTSTYAHIFDSTMKREFHKFKGGMVDITGQVVDEESIAKDISQGADNVDAQWLKRHISAQALPNGLCAMPVVQTCDKANACLTCGNFRTDARYLEQHKEQLERTCQILDTAKANGWSRQIEMNQRLKDNLLNIITPLESNDGA
jgi:integrase/recombinase XerD